MILCFNDKLTDLTNNFGIKWRQHYHKINNKKKFEYIKKRREKNEKNCCNASLIVSECI